MEKKNLCVAFSTQKGGAGKTTLTVLVASYLHYVKGYDVAVVDCDYPQYSIAEMRERDLKMATDNDYYKSLAYQQFTRLNKRMYPVVKSLPEKAAETAKALQEKGKYDIIFFDLPGTVNKEGVIYTLSIMDYIFAPISADHLVLKSTLRFASRLNDTLITTGKAKIKGLYLIWNQVDGREKSELYDVYEQIIAELGLLVLKTFIPNSLRFRRELLESHKALFRSTLFPVDKTLLKGSNVDELVEEVLGIINL
ncbi:ParA family protein [Bacteroides reticulotermitis]|uniref:Conjugative transposon protein TraA n=2 Tax=Bacteroides reticulotermitis TaxID=1133319 RepID=W4V0V9_9BACE|nr:ParA family protein [Bacteroides reticulotermitis]MBB4046328.1 cellulose biosynthesis protein BcsQ [Bacteroides reticulotermitis]GAE86379.1 conjugative transposon protein TraA [Bacteroides reticulotermitis JCM 10512]